MTDSKSGCILLFTYKKDVMPDAKFPFYTIDEATDKLSEVRGKPYTTRAVLKMIERGVLPGRKANPRRSNSDMLIPAEALDKYIASLKKTHDKKRGQAAKAT